VVGEWRDCAHLRTEFRSRQGLIRVWIQAQCAYCGIAVGRKRTQEEAHTLNLGQLHPWRRRKRPTRARREFLARYRRADWRRLRLRRLGQDGYICTTPDCDGEAVEVHHLTYDRFGQERLSDLRSVCELCHDLLHGRRS